MFKKLIKGAIVGAGMLALAATAQAVEYNINLYGASAQYLFWNDLADDYLQAIYGATTQQAQDAGKKNGITKGTTATDTYYIRYSAKASFDGLRACCGEDPANTCTEGPRYRKMADETQTDFGTGVVNNTACKIVTIGCSDVAWDSFGQSSSGAFSCDNATVVNQNIGPITCMDGWDSDKVFQTVIVPFGFFANNNWKTTADGSALPNTNGELDNLTRLQALMIFSGKVDKPSKFGANYSDRNIRVCLRHAGSGTHATLDRAVMRGDQPLANTGGLRIKFNDGSSDMMKCINTNCNSAASVGIGYADADQADACGPGKTYANTYAMKYEGAAPIKSNIANGVYSFWSANWCYVCTADTDPNTAVASNMMTWSANNMPASKAAWWVKKAEMNVTKANDFAMPTF